MLPIGLGYVESVTHDYRRHGTTTLFAPLTVENGAVLAECKARRRHHEFPWISACHRCHVPAELDIHVKHLQNAQTLAMNSTTFSRKLFSSMSAAERDPESAPRKPTVRVKELSERHRRRLLTHFLGLGESDRQLRFGTTVGDESITQYVQRIDFARDTVFGVYDSKFKLVGAGHLAFGPSDAFPVIYGATDKARVGEFGVSVSEAARGLGIGSKLFERAAIHCRNEDVDTLYMHCLATNQIMIHIAKKAGMEIHHKYGEADAYLKLLPGSPSSALQEAVEEQAAAFDYNIKANTSVVVNLLERLPGFKAD